MSSRLNEFKKYLKETRIPLRLSCRTEGGWPVVLSLWYVYEDGRLYCATQASAKVVSYLENDPRCAFEIAGDHPPYCGVRGPARAAVDERIGAEVLQKLLQRYLGGLDNSLAEKLLEKSESEVALVIEPLDVYSWDFSPRMRDALAAADQPKVCP